MDMTKFNCLVSATKVLNDGSASFAFKDMGKGFKSRIERLVDIHSSVVDFFRKNLDFIVKNAIFKRKSGWSDGHTTLTMFGTPSQEHLDVILDKGGNVIDVIIHKLLGEGYHYDPIGIGYWDVCKTEDEFTKLVGVGKLPHYRIFHGKFRDLTEGTVQQIESEISQSERYYDEVYLPMFEDFLIKMKDRQAKRYNELAKIAEKNGTKAGRFHKVVIEISYPED